MANINRINANGTDYTLAIPAMETVYWNADGVYMQDGQSIPIPKGIKNYQIGVWLHWAPYNSSTYTSQKYNNCFTFIPRNYVETRSGQGVACPISSVNSSGANETLCCKYVYVNNNTIAGNKKNNLESCKNWVLVGVYAI